MGPGLRDCQNSSLESTNLYVLLKCYFPTCDRENNHFRGFDSVPGSERTTRAEGVTGFMGLPSFEDGYYGPRIPKDSYASLEFIKSLVVISAPFTIISTLTTPTGHKCPFIHHNQHLNWIQFRLLAVSLASSRDKGRQSKGIFAIMSISGKYEMVSSENFDEYLKAVGVGLVTRKLANNSKPTIEVTENGDKYLFKTITTFKTIDLDFEVGKEFTEETADGRKAQTTITRNGNVFTQTQKIDKLNATITRTFSDNTLTAVFQAGDVTSTRVYKKA
ncbi:unnamed protein product [Allacma fusca]|uniref:Fatty acid-binding protein, muscle n=1 Tax=Allacma fusca TaxID=39272 RepID=A0A8J2LB75_9HEXA|nr:unnamed protein product [Allacma fusca]